LSRGANPECTITGPVSRGDVATVRGHVEAMRVGGVDVKTQETYRTLCLTAVQMSKHKLKEDVIHDLEDIFEESSKRSRR